MLVVVVPVAEEDAKLPLGYWWLEAMPAVFAHVAVPFLAPEQIGRTALGTFGFCDNRHNSNSINLRLNAGGLDTDSTEFLWQHF